MGTSRGSHENLDDVISTVRNAHSSPQPSEKRKKSTKKKSNVKIPQFVGAQSGDEAQRNTKGSWGKTPSGDTHSLYPGQKKGEKKERKGWQHHPTKAGEQTIVKKKHKRKSKGLDRFCTGVSQQRKDMEEKWLNESGQRNDQKKSRSQTSIRVKKKKGDNARTRKRFEQYDS